MASIYKEGSGWSARVRMNGKSICSSAKRARHVAIKRESQPSVFMIASRDSPLLPAAQIRRNLAA